MKAKGSNFDRRSFFKKGAVALAGWSVLPSVLSASGKSLAAEGKNASGLTSRMLGKTGVSLPLVSMGVMNADNENLVRAALDAGIIHLDTAHGYQRGRNEEMIGRVIKNRPRDSYFLATKVPGIPRDRQTGRFSAETKGETFLEMFDLSLKRLGLDHVDILYLHNVMVRDSVLFEPLISALAKAKKSGKTRFVGVSTHSNEHEVIRAAVESRFYDVVLAAYNFRKDNLAELDAAIVEAAKAGVGIIAMKTQAGVTWDKERQNPINMKAALRWALKNPHITTAIPGFTTFDQLELDMEVAKAPFLTEQDLKDLRLGQQTGGLYCQQCNACLPQCGQKLPVPELMRSYMYAYGYRNLEAAHGLLAELGVGDNPCRDCASCTVACRKNFNVRDRVTDITRLAALPADFLA